MSIYPGLVALTYSGAEYLVDSTRGSKNVKGRKIVDGQVTDSVYVIPRAGVKDTRPLSPLETATSTSDVKVRTGSVVFFKKAMKGYSEDTLFVVFKVAGDGSFNVIEVGGNKESRYFRGVRPGSVVVVDPTQIHVD